MLTYEKRRLPDLTAFHYNDEKYLCIMIFWYKTDKHLYLLHTIRSINFKPFQKFIYTQFLSSKFHLSQPLDRIANL